MVAVVSNSEAKRAGVEAKEYLYSVVPLDSPTGF
jgi:hypothetical protein